MMRKLFLGCLFLAMTVRLFAQQQPVSASQFNLPTIIPAMTPATGGSVGLVGNPGPATYCYWLVTNYTAGSLSPILAGCLSNAPSTLSGSNYDHISFSVPAQASSVDVLRTTSLSKPPSGACNCAVATANTSGTVNDQSNSTSSYTVTSFDPTSLGLSLTNEVISAGVSHLILRQQPSGTKLADLNTGGGGTGTVTSVGSGAGLAGGPITGSGSLILDLAHANTFTATQTFSIAVSNLFTGTENGSAPTPTSGFDYLYPSSTNHCLELSSNARSLNCIGRAHHLSGAADTGSANAYVIAPAEPALSYSTGDTYSFVPANSNSGTSTINVSSLGTQSITKCGANVLASGDIVAGIAAIINYDGTEFQLLNPQAVACTPGSLPAISSGTNGRVLFNNGISALWDSNLDDGATTPNALTYQGSAGANFTGNQITVGASPPTALPTGAAGFAFTETSTAGTPTSAIDYIRASSTAHALVASQNNGAESPLVLNSTLPSVLNGLASFALNDNSGSTTAYTVPDTAMTAYTAGVGACFVPQTTNTTTTPTVNFNSLGATSIEKFGTVAVAVGDIVAGVPACVVYDSTASVFELINPAAVVGTGKFCLTSNCQIANFVNTNGPIRDESYNVLVAAMTADSGSVNIGSTGAGNSTFSFTVANALWYEMTCDLPVTFASSATIKFQLVSVSGGVTLSFVNSRTMGNTGASAAFQDLTTIGGSSLAGSVTPVTGAPGASETILYRAQFLTSHAGNIGLEFTGNGTNNVTLLEGGSCHVTGIS